MNIRKTRRQMSEDEDEFLTTCEVAHILHARICKLGELCTHLDAESYMTALMDRNKALKVCRENWKNLSSAAETEREYEIYRIARERINKRFNLKHH